MRGCYPRKDAHICRRSARMHRAVTASCNSRPQQVAVGSVAETGAADDRLMAAASRRDTGQLSQRGR